MVSLLLRLINCPLSSPLASWPNQHRWCLLLKMIMSSVRRRQEDYYYPNYHSAAGGGQSSVITVCDVLAWSSLVSDTSSHQYCYPAPATQNSHLITTRNIGLGLKETHYIFKNLARKINSLHFSPDASFVDCCWIAGSGPNVREMVRRIRLWSLSTQQLSNN